MPCFEILADSFTCLHVSGLPKGSLSTSNVKISAADLKRRYLINFCYCAKSELSWLLFFHKIMSYFDYVPVHHQNDVMIARREQCGHIFTKSGSIYILLGIFFSSISCFTIMLKLTLPFTYNFL